MTFFYYLRAGKVSEGQVKFLVVGPLLRLTGFYRHPIQINLEQDIADITTKDEDTVITGRYDVLSINRATPMNNGFFFWVLVIEAKNSQVEALVGLPQLLTYAYQSLEYQESVWGLTTNGVRYQFVHVQRGNPPTYLYMPELDLVDSERLTQLLQVLKAICKL
jgi:hypothetical protein